MSSGFQVKTAALLVLLALPVKTFAFGWADNSVTTLFKFLGTGRISAPDEASDPEKANGHTLATRRAFQYAIGKSTEAQKLLLEDIMGSSIQQLDTENGFVMQNIVWGNFRSEVHTQLSDFLSGYVKLATELEQVLPKISDPNNPDGEKTIAPIDDVIASLKQQMDELLEKETESGATNKALTQLEEKLKKLTFLQKTKARLAQEWKALAFVLADHEGIFGETPFVSDTNEAFPISMYTDLTAKYGLHTSTGYIHSMLVDGGDAPLSHGQTLAKIRTYAVGMMSSVLTKLVTTKKNPHLTDTPPDANLAVKLAQRKSVIQEALANLQMPADQLQMTLAFFEQAGYTGLNPIPSESNFSNGPAAPSRYENQSRHWRNPQFRSALMNLGGLFHLIQDSTVGCTEKTKTKTIALANGADIQGSENFAVCQVGDGHSLFNPTADRVIGLSSGHEYFDRVKQHSTLDSLYRSHNLYTVPELLAGEFDRNDMEKLYDGFDPAIAAGDLLLDLLQSVDSLANLSDETLNEALAEAATSLVERHILSRYAINLE